VLYIWEKYDVQAIGQIDKDHAIEELEIAKVQELQSRPNATVQHPGENELFGELSIAFDDGFTLQETAEVKDQEDVDGRHDQLIGEDLMKDTPSIGAW